MTSLRAATRFVDTVRVTGVQTGGCEGTFLVQVLFTLEYFDVVYYCVGLGVNVATKKINKIN